MTGPAEAVGGEGGSPARARADGDVGRKGGRPTRARAEAVADGEMSNKIAEFLVITGLSGAGRSESAKVLEDLGFFVIDNLPPSLIRRFAELAAEGETRSRLALVADARGGSFSGSSAELVAELAALRRRGVRPRVLFLEASDEVLVRRFEATRRRHPVRGDGVVESIARERRLLLGLREHADLVIDTSDLNVHQLRDKLLTIFDERPGLGGLLVTVTSFGFKHGLPLDADLVLDVRFLPNPHWVPELRAKTGRDPDVRAYVLAQEETGQFLERVRELLEVTLPGYLREGKQYLTIAIGCTGGRHRSVVLAEELGAWLGGQADRNVRVRHRDVERE